MKTDLHNQQEIEFEKENLKCRKINSARESKLNRKYLNYL